MDLEGLNKSQMVLLTLLVSFVTSIATGIVTVSLMDEAPQAITQTVNRIVERTVEKVVPEAIGQVAAASNTVTEKIVTVRESDLMAQAIASLEPSVVRLYTPGRDESGKDISLFVGIAVVQNMEGLLVSDIGTPEGSLSALRADGISVPLKALERKTGAKVLYLQAATTSSVTKEGKTETINLSWKPAAFSRAQPRLGEHVVAIGGRTTSRVADGIITAIPELKDDAATPLLETTISGDEFSAGSPLINIQGEIIGLATRESRAVVGGFLAWSEQLLYNNDTGKSGTP